MAPKKQPEKATGNAIAALILGILALIIPGIGLILAIIAIILGIGALKHQASKNYGIAGIIMGGVSIILHIIIIIGLVMFATSLAKDPAAAMQNIPGLAGCNTDGPVMCANYTYTDNMALTLTGGQEVTSIKADLIDKELKNSCIWQGATNATTTASFILTCERAPTANDVMSLTISYLDGVGPVQETYGLIVPRD